jgi:hypothetical protein
MSAALDGSIRNISDNVLEVRIGAVIDVLGGSDMAIIDPAWVILKSIVSRSSLAG